MTIHPSRTHEFGWKRTLSKMDPQETSERTLSFIFLIIDHLCLFSSSFPSSLSMLMSLSIVHRHHNMFHQIIQSSNISIISSVIIHHHPTISFIISIIHYSDSSFTLKTAGYLPSQNSMRLVPFAWSSLGQVGDGRISMHLTFTDRALLD